MTTNKKTWGKITMLEYGRHDDHTRWFSFYFYIGKWATLFWSRKTQAYDTAFQSGVGFMIRRPFYLAFFLSILDYPEGSHVEKHRDGGIDPARMKAVFGCNVNIVLRKAERGGRFICPEAYVDTGRIKIFNGDRYAHEVTAVEKGRRTIFAFKCSLARFIASLNET